MSPTKSSSGHWPTESILMREEGDGVAKEKIETYAFDLSESETSKDVPLYQNVSRDAIYRPLAETNYHWIQVHFKIRARTGTRPKKAQSIAVARKMPWP